jgi:hypothetical protein
MTFRKVFAMLATSVALGCNGAAPTPGLPPATEAPAAAPQERLTLTAERQDYLPYQTVGLLASYQGAQGLALRPGADEVRVRVRRPDGTDATLLPLARYCFGLERERGRDREVLDVTVDQRGWVFLEPGRYSVTLEAVHRPLSSNPVTINVVQPTREEDREAGALIAAMPSYADFHSFDGSDRLVEALALTTKLAEGASSYREDARDLLVRHWARQSTTPAGEIRAPDPERALRYYDRVSAAQTRGFSKVRSLWYLKRLATTSMNVHDELERLRQREPAFEWGALQSVRLQ